MFIFEIRFLLHIAYIAGLFVKNSVSRIPLVCFHALDYWFSSLLDDNGIFWSRILILLIFIGIGVKVRKFLLISRSIIRVISSIIGRVRCDYIWERRFTLNFVLSCHFVTLRRGVIVWIYLIIKSYRWSWPALVEKSHSSCL